MDRNATVKWLEQYIGIAEGSAKHKEIIKIYNTQGGNHRYTVKVSDAWCATAVSAAFIAVGYKEIFPCIECGCANMITLAKKAKIWVEDDSYNAQVGDVIMYDWDDKGSGDCKGNPDHVGIIASNDGSKFRVIEGNKSDTVGYRDVPINGAYIRGFITPKYDSVVESKTEVSTGYYAESKDVNLAGYYKTTTELNLRERPRVDSRLFTKMPKNTKVTCYGYYTTTKGTKWLLVKTKIGAVSYTGYCSSKYLKFTG